MQKLIYANQNIRLPKLIEELAAAGIVATGYVAAPDIILVVDDAVLESNVNAIIALHNPLLKSSEEVKMETKRAAVETLSLVDTSKLATATLTELSEIVKNIVIVMTN